MAGGANIDDDDGITEINVTPFVDVMLVLLIIFMVTANYMNNPGIDLKLPEAETGAGIEASQLTFTIDRNSVIYAEGKALDEQALAALVKSKKKADPKIQATIAADQETPHGAVIKLIDLVRKNGISDFAINVEAGP